MNSTFLAVYNAGAHVIFGSALVFAAIGLRAALPTRSTMSRLLRRRER